MLIGLSASLIFFIIDKFAPGVAFGTRQGSGFGIGYGLVGGGGQPEGFEYGNAKGNSPLSDNTHPETVTGVPDYDENDSTVEEESTVGMSFEHFKDMQPNQTKPELFDEGFDEGFDTEKAADNVEPEGFESKLMSGGFPLDMHFDKIAHNNAVY